jgi:hypothetical protein
MRTVRECLDKAAEMDARAARLPEGAAAEWLSMAEHWRVLALQASWQDHYNARPRS